MTVKEQKKVGVAVGGLILLNQAIDAGDDRKELVFRVNDIIKELELMMPSDERR